MRFPTIGVAVATLVACCGVGLAVAAPQPPDSSVRTLRPGEAASLTGGLCHDCVDCDTYRATCAGYGVNNCTAENGQCTTDPASLARGTGTVTQKCVESGPLAGGCGAVVNDSLCLSNGDMCRCHAVPPNWECRRTNPADSHSNFRKAPCS
jgi:hypothetical protein